MRGFQEASAPPYSKAAAFSSSLQVRWQQGHANDGFVVQKPQQDIVCRKGSRGTIHLGHLLPWHNCACEVRVKQSASGTASRQLEQQQGVMRCSVHLSPVVLWSAAGCVLVLVLAVAAVAAIST